MACCARGAAAGPDGEPLPGRRPRRPGSASGCTAEPPGGRRQRARGSRCRAGRAGRRAVADEPPARPRRFVGELDDRADAAHAPTVQGVTLASLHAAKGLEWDAVFLSAWSTARCRSARRGRRRRSRRSGGCSTSASPGPGGTDAVLGAGAHPGGRRRAPPRFLDGLLPDEHPAARGPSGDARPAARSRGAGCAASRCSARRRGSWAAARTARPTTTRTCSSGCGTGGAARRRNSRCRRSSCSPTPRSRDRRAPPGRTRRCWRSRHRPPKLEQYGEDVLALVGWGETAGKFATP